MKAIKNAVFVLIDKKAQNEKRSKIGSLYIPENYQFMAYNLQYGPVVSIGESVKKTFPSLQKGDILIFHHSIEYKPRENGDLNHNDVNLIDRLDNNDEIRRVDITEKCFGYVSLSEEKIIPHPKYIFCTKDHKHSEFQKRSNGIYLANEWKLNAEAAQQKLERLGHELTGLVETEKGKLKTREQILQRPLSTVEIKSKESEIYKFTEELRGRMNEIRKEQKELTDKIHATTYSDVKVLNVNSETAQFLGVDIKAGDTLTVNENTIYPLSFMGLNYTIVNKFFIAAVNKVNLVNGFTIIKQIKEKQYREFIIPDSVDQKLKLALIIKSSDTELENKTALMDKSVKGVEIFYDDTPHLLINNKNIAATIS